LAQDVDRLNTANVDAVVLSACVQMQSLPVIQQVEDRLGIPVTSTSVCTVRRMLDCLGLEPIVPGAGALLSAEFAAQRATVPAGQLA
jgi:maleate isomerase